MTVDYRKFKTPFYEVSIFDSKGNSEKKLPRELLRLIEKVEIFEPITVSENQYGTIILVFNEGSREPSKRGSINKSLSYLPNSTGLITDITFDTGLPVNKEELSVETVEEKNKTSKSIKEVTVSPKYLFQERNQLQVTWGYKEDPQSIRKVRAYIILLSTDFVPEGTKTTITCQESSLFLDQITPKNAVAFGQRIKTSKGNSVIETVDPDTDAMLRDITSKNNIPAIISKNLPVSKFSESTQKAWISGQSFKQFMDKLAEEHHANWRSVISPKTGQDILYFIAKKDFDKEFIPVYDKNLFTYSAPGSILKSVNVRVDFGIPVGSTQKGTDLEGNEIGQQEINGDSQMQMFSSNNKLQTVVNTDPNSTNRIGITEKIANGVAGKTNITANVDTSPRTNVGNQKEKAEVEAAATVEKAIQIDFSTIGFTKLTPGTVNLLGIGKRYSGPYRIISCTHTIDSSGYVTKCAATSFALPAGGVTTKSSEKTNSDVQVTKQIMVHSNQSSVVQDWHVVNGTSK